MILLKLTIAEILHYPEFSGFTLIAGAKGISNQITSCGILDYEYDRTLKKKYTKLSFIPNQLILSSLQYAKEDPGCLIDAIRLLHHRNCSGLVIKNVYSLPLSSHILRFADSAGFPIILIKSSEQYFEKIIINIYKRLQSLHDFDKFEHIISRIIALPEHDEHQKELQLEVNPCLQPDIFCMYFRSDAPLTANDYMKMEYAAKYAGLLTSYNTLLRYKNGLLYIHSSHNFKNARPDELAQQILDTPVGALAISYHMGVSSIHYRERKIKLCIEEAIYSSYFHTDLSHPYQLYDALGIYSILLPYCHEPAMQHFTSSILNPIRDYDSENHTSLMETAISFIQCRGNINRTAEVLGQHKNTIRYRLKQVSHLLSCDILQPESYEKLSVALKIAQCYKIEL